MSHRVAFLGDSFTLGVGDPEGLGWVGRLGHAWRAAGQDVTAYNLGIRGNTSADIASRWLAESTCRMSPAFPFGFVFCFGVNDCILENGAVRVSAAQTLTHAQAILSAARELAPTVMVGPPPIADADVNKRVADLNPKLAALCAALSIPYVDVFDALLSSPVWMREVAAVDGAHPGAAGYEVWVGLLLRNDILRTPPRPKM